MQLSDTLDLPSDSTSGLPSGPNLARLQQSVEACSDSSSEEGRLEDDLIIRTVPTVRGFKVLGGAALYGRLGRGGMGAVYRARHLELGIDVAVKCLMPNPGKEQPGTLTRFEREVALTAQIDHPNVVQVLDSGQVGDLRYLVLEYVHGETLRRRVRRLGALPWQEALAIAKRAARGLGAAHNLSLVHRDVKPENLMVGCSGEVKVCDLGLIKSEGSADGLTRSFSLLGTPRYMAPEQWEGASNVGPAADIYGLGACLYLMLTGRDARRSADLSELRRMVVTEPFPAVRDAAPEVPADLAAVLQRCVEKDPAKRYQSGDELAAALDAIGMEEASAVFDGGAETVPPSQRDAGPARSEEVALRRALARRSSPVRSLIGRVPVHVLWKASALAAAWGAGWAWGAKATVLY